MSAVSQRRPTVRRNEADLSNDPPACDLADAQREHTAELTAWRESIFGEDGVWGTDVAPALKVIHGVGTRLDALCRWLSGRWPWIVGVAVLVLSRTVEAAPDEFPKLLEAAAKVIGAVL
jgi:hypothetical protein